MSGNDRVETQAVIQARMGSSRLPGKILLDLQGMTVLGHVVRRTRAVSRIARVVVATTTQPEDDAVESWCKTAGVPCFRGSAMDVLERFAKCVTVWPCRRVVRITADCPLIDPGVVDDVIAMHETGAFDYVSNLHPPTFPHGLDVEALSTQLLKRVAEEATLPSHREHVTLFIRENRDHFKFGNVTFGRDASRFRVTLDRPEDYEFLKALLALIPPATELPSLYEMLRLLEAHPEIVAINGGQDRYEGVRKAVKAEKRTLTLG
ncbi:MAG TPA: glycosyltransferase family protein [Candidatus Ozemobacteraceae bacterium]|nr:glycosyltransferase family protein [Candidatus Ozemobacteraceae bacterium]HQG29105.1 glycosyltransferase family protein [Candidatus Ozemobacteraceae bacterium]